METSGICRLASAGQKYCFFHRNKSSKVLKSESEQGPLWKSVSCVNFPPLLSESHANFFDRKLKSRKNDLRGWRAKNRSSLDYASRQVILIERNCISCKDSTPFQYESRTIGFTAYASYFLCRIAALCWLSTRSAPVQGQPNEAYIITLITQYFHHANVTTITSKRQCIPGSKPCPCTSESHHIKRKDSLLAAVALRLIDSQAFNTRCSLKGCYDQLSRCLYGFTSLSLNRKEAVSGSRDWHWRDGPRFWYFSRKYVSFQFLRSYDYNVASD